MSIELSDVSDAPYEAYRASIDRGVLAYQHCGNCAKAVFPPRSRCPECGADALQWRESGAAATVYALTVIAPRESAPYYVVLVDLDEGFRMMSRMDDAHAQPLVIGDRVRVTFVEMESVLQPCVVAEGGNG